MFVKKRQVITSGVSVYWNVCVWNIVVQNIFIKLLLMVTWSHFLIPIFDSQERQQPSFFEDLDQLYEFLQTAGKKPVYMSQKTLDTLQTLKDEYEQNDVHEQDPIGHFVERQAVKLGLHVSSGKWTFFLN